MNVQFKTPPYTLTEKAADYLVKIAETVTRLEFGTGFKHDLKLHRKNRVRTIHSSLAIEGNSLSLDAVTAVIQEQHQVKHQEKHQVELGDMQVAVLNVLENGTLSRKEIFAAIGMSGDHRAFKRTIEPLLIAGHVEMTIPDKPNSKLQKYRLTPKGKATIRQ